MPNIAICGFPAAKAVQIRDQIRTALKSKEPELAQDAVTSISPMTVESVVGGNPEPYLVIKGTDKDEVALVYNALRDSGIDYDTELQLLHSFLQGAPKAPDSPAT